MIQDEEYEYEEGMMSDMILVVLVLVGGWRQPVVRGSYCTTTITAGDW